jgi:glycosyltransferase involved in cell wall biosynthesis
MAAKAPLAGRTVALVHPAWASCGTATVVASQARGYRALGARVLSVALSDHPGFGLGSKSLIGAYLQATPELVADQRLVTGISRGAALNPATSGPIAWGFAHGNFAATYVALAENSAIPAEIRGERLDLIHCNHFFCMPLAEALRAAQGCPVVLDSHDIQAKQYVLRNQGGWYLPPRATFEAMLATELRCLSRADLLIHLNSEEAAAFRSLLPGNRHTLLYPAVEPMPTGPGAGDFVIVASGNIPNILSLEWFLREVAPRAGDLRLAIYGNVDAAIRSREPALHRRFLRYFRGRTDDIAAAYAQAACVLLPTVEGHGLSIKTIEALSSGAPLLATRLAFRGIDIDPTTLANVSIADGAEAFAAEIRKAAAGRPPDSGAREASPTRRLYESRFSPAAYQQGLAELVGPLLARAGGA